MALSLYIQKSTLDMQSNYLEICNIYLNILSRFWKDSAVQ